MLSKIKTIFTKNRLAVYLLVAFLIFFVALLFLLKQSSLINEVIEKGKPGEAIKKEINTEISAVDPARELSNFREKAISLDTAEKVVTYLNEHYLNRDERAVSFFGAMVLRFNNYETAILEYETAEGFINTVVLARDDHSPRYIAVTNEGIKMFMSGWSLEDFFNKEEERIKAKIVRFAVFDDPFDILKDFEWTER